MSNEVYFDHNNVCHEGTGIPPNVEMDIFDATDVLKLGHAEAIATIVALAKTGLVDSPR